ncbi:hypothetical protein DPMN_104709 [Dreissena polymorpha]|uniref:Uncharacterized protein n=1 Tax=Dreissena polymorpha TaxID=45954 RepID=A0A9D4K2V0_DREPO|nr:hypothetical protein DPMN_104709 [Dreissena polymorpha]
MKHNLQIPDFIMKKIGTNANLQEFTTLELLVEALTELELLKTRLQSFESSELTNSTLRNSEKMTGDSIMMEGVLSDWNSALDEASSSTVTLPNIREALPVMQPPLQSSSEPNTVIYDSQTSATPSCSKPYDVDIPIKSQVTVSQKQSITDIPEVVATKQDSQLSIPGLLGPGSIEVATKQDSQLSITGLLRPG